MSVGSFRYTFIMTVYPNVRCCCYNVTCRFMIGSNECTEGHVCRSWCSNFGIWQYNWIVLHCIVLYCIVLYCLLSGRNRRGRRGVRRGRRGRRGPVNNSVTSQYQAISAVPHLDNGNQPASSNWVPRRLKTKPVSISVHCYSGTCRLVNLFLYVRTRSLLFV